jgi:hypothetical protein
MFEMLKSTITLFFRGKLFAEPAKAYTQLMAGILFTALVFIACAQYPGLPIWAAAAAAGFLGGAFQPFLFRNLRYR